MGMTSEKKSLLVDELLQAVEDAAPKAGRLPNIFEQMKRSGSNLCVVVNIVSISPTDDPQRDFVPEPRLASTGELILTAADLKFLKQLKISVG
ncbi:MAG: hypothetical protein JOZ32_08625 [Bryobacterales bacterium]|nr:hypothetical protein [Bryobacterales bacterium]